MYIYIISFFYKTSLSYIVIITFTCDSHSRKKKKRFITYKCGSHKKKKKNLGLQNFSLLLVTIIMWLNMIDEKRIMDPYVSNC